MTLLRLIVGRYFEVEARRDLRQRAITEVRSAPVSTTSLARPNGYMVS